MVSELTSSALSCREEPKLFIQGFHQCSTLVSIKLNFSNFLLWKAQILPFIKSLGIIHHLAEGKPTEEIVGDDGKKGINPNYVFWLNNDGLLVSWLSGIMIVDIFSMINGGETAKDVWSSLEEQLLPNTVKK